MGKGPVLINTPPHTKTHTSAPSSAFFKSNQIPCELSACPLSGECTQSRAQTCHSEEAKKSLCLPKKRMYPPSNYHTHTHTNHLHFCFRFYEKSCVLSRALLISQFLIQRNRAFLKNTEFC